MSLLIFSAVTARSSWVIVKQRWIDAVYKQIKDKGFCFTLTQKYQNQLAKKLTELVPSSELSIFLKTGSDATTASIRIAGPIQIN